MPICAIFIFCSLSKMTSLKQLDLSGNYLSGDRRLSEKLSELTNLAILDLCYCKLEVIPDRYVTDTSHINAVVEISNLLNVILLTWYISLSKNLTFLNHLWIKPGIKLISAKWILFLLFVGLTGGKNSSEIGQYGPFFLTKFRKFYGWYLVAAIKIFIYNICVKFYGWLCEIILILHGDGVKSITSNIP